MKQKSNKKFDKADYGNICRSRDLEAQNKMSSTITQGSYLTWSCSSLKASLVLTQKLLSFASSKKRGSAKQALPPLVTRLLTML